MPSRAGHAPVSSLDTRAGEWKQSASVQPGRRRRRCSSVWEEYRRSGRARVARPADLHVHADGPLHRLPQGARGTRPVRRRGLPLLRPGGADPLDRPLRPRQGRHARAVRLDADPRRRARRAAPPRLGAALAAPRRAHDQQRPRDASSYAHERQPDPRRARRAGRHEPRPSWPAASTRSRSPRSAR